MRKQPADRPGCGKTYYVHIRAFKKFRGKKYVSDWSKVLSKKVK